MCGIAKAKYNHCGTVLSCGLGISHLNKHIRQIHCFNQPTIEELLENNQYLVKPKVVSLEFRNLIHWLPVKKFTTVIVKHDIPLRFGEYEAFKDFVNYCNPLVKYMSKNTLKSEIFKIYNVEKVKAMNLLEIIIVG